MIYILNNIKFGHPKLGKYQLEYFRKHFIPLYNKNRYHKDKIIILGDLFYNTKHITFELLEELFDHVFWRTPGLIEIVGNDYCYNSVIHGAGWENGKMKPIKKFEFNLVDLPFSMFQLNKEDKNPIGYYTIDDSDKLTFVNNDFTPKFVEYTINTIEDLDNVKLTKDFIYLTINSELLDNQQYKNLIDIFLNNNTFNNIFYTEKINEDEKVNMDSRNINIRNILINNVEDDLKGELDEIFVIYDEKKQ
jgi:hypothetical protein